MANYNLTQTFADGQTHTVSFTIPETAGTYQMTATLTNADGTTRTINAGTVVVAAKANTYNVAFDMGNSSTLTTTLATPALGATMTIPVLQDGIAEIEYDYMDKDNINRLAYAGNTSFTIQVMPGTTVSYAIVLSSSDFIPYNTEEVVNYEVGDSVTSGTFPTVYAKYGREPDFYDYSQTTSSVSVILRNMMSNTAAGMSLYYSDLPQGTYNLVGSTSSSVTAGDDTTITKTGLSANTTYYFKAKYFDINGNIKDGDLSSYTSIKTASDTYTVTIPARKTGIKILTYNYVNASGNTATVNAGTSNVTITVKAGTKVSRAGYTLSNTKYYQFWSGNKSSWTINSNNYTLPAQYAQYKGTPTITSTSTTSSSVGVTGKNTLGISARLQLYKATSPNGTYTAVGFSPIIANNSTSTVHATQLAASTQYWFKMAYYDGAGNVMTGSMSSYVTTTTDAEQTT